MVGFNIRCPNTPACVCALRTCPASSPFTGRSSRSDPGVHLGCRAAPSWLWSHRLLVASICHGCHTVLPGPLRDHMCIWCHSWGLARSVFAFHLIEWCATNSWGLRRCFRCPCCVNDAPIWTPVCPSSELKLPLPLTPNHALELLLLPPLPPLLLEAQGGGRRHHGTSTQIGCPRP